LIYLSFIFETLQAAGDTSTDALRDALAVYGIVPTGAGDPYHEFESIQQPAVQHGAAVSRMPAIEHSLSPEQVTETLVCPITGDVFRDPVVCQDGQTYERSAIERWLVSHQTSPMTNAVLPNTALVPNLALRHQIEDIAATADCQPQAVAHIPAVSIKCVVLDFDQTLSTKQVGMFDLSTQVADRCFGGATRVRLLEQLFRELRDLAIQIVVLTRNSEYTVQKALAAVGLEGCQVIGNEEFDMDVPKSVSIRKGVLEPLNLEPREVLFVDDEMGNIQDVGEQVCCPCVHVDNVGQRMPGINSHYCNLIRRLCIGG